MPNYEQITVTEVCKSTTNALTAKCFPDISKYLGLLRVMYEKKQKGTHAISDPRTPSHTYVSKTVLIYRT